MNDDHVCYRCGEPLTPDDFDRSHRYRYTSTWDACFHAATSDDERIARVHKRMVEKNPMGYRIGRYQP